MDSLVGKCIDDKYDIEKLIASGGMGEVYLAHQKGSGQTVAIKKLKREYYQDQVVVERFINEAKLYGRVPHPNAVKLHDVLKVDDQICIVMEYVDGKTLASMLKSGYVFTTRQIVDIALQIADALATLHKAGIIHRDLKTDNIMLIETVSRRFSVKILDFGIAKFKDGSSNSITQQGVIVGTPEFMSPEQCYGLPVDLRADIYSYGILLYVMICGRLPFEAPSALALLNKQANDPLPEMKRPDSSEIPPGLKGVVLKCAMKKAEDRYQSFVDVIADLTCLQEGRKTSVELVPIARVQKSSKPKPFKAIIIIVLLLAAAGGLGFIHFHKTNQEVQIEPVKRPNQPAEAQTTTAALVPQNTLPHTNTKPEIEPAHRIYNTTISLEAPQKDAGASPKTDTGASPKDSVPAPSTNDPTKVEPAQPSTNVPQTNPTPNKAPAPAPSGTKKAEPAQPKTTTKPNKPQNTVPAASSNAPKKTEPTPEQKPSAAPEVSKDTPKDTPAQNAPTEQVQNSEPSAAPQITSRVYDSSVSLDFLDSPKKNLKGKLQITAKPPCIIKINGKVYGETPKTIDLPVGEYNISCEQGGKLIGKRSVDLLSGDTHKIVFEQ